ncbi:MAG: LysR family transcriptional regulator [Verrucomicrobia bacterium]|nr:LysR family transcriptional regulator [Verrucomicrobiota bacterium]
MEIRHLRYFVAVAEELSFTRAATVLHVAQSAVSAQVRLLEDAVGVMLVERNSRRVELTSAGRAFLRGAKKIMFDLDEMIRQTRRIGRAETGHLAVGFIGSQSHEWMPLVLKRFRQEHPDVEVTLTEMVPSAQLEALSTHRLDLGVVGPIDGKPPAGLNVECLVEEPPLVGVPSDHPLAGRPFVRLQQLKDENFILTSRENAPSYRSWLARLCQRAGFSPKVVQEVDRARTCVQYVAAGFGISIFGEHICRQPAPGVTFIPLRPSGQKIRYGIAWRKEPSDPLVRRFVDYTREQLQAKLPGGFVQVESPLRGDRLPGAQPRKPSGLAKTRTAF